MEDEFVIQACVSFSKAKLWPLSWLKTGKVNGNHIKEKSKKCEDILLVNFRKLIFNMGHRHLKGEKNLTS